MRYLFVSFLLLFAGTVLGADRAFDVQLENAEYNVFLRVNLYEESLQVPGQPVLGATHGYLMRHGDGRAWIVLEGEIAADGRSATLTIVNDYGSDDLDATLTIEPDGTYTLRQEQGSTIKVAGRGKWIKLPKTLTMTRRK